MGEEKEEEHEEELTEAEQEYDDLTDAENKLENELLKGAFYYFAAIIILGGGLIYLTQNIPLGVVVSGLISWMAGFRLVGLSVAWGRIHAEKIKLGVKGGVE